MLDMQMRGGEGMLVSSVRWDRRDLMRSKRKVGNKRPDGHVLVVVVAGSEPEIPDDEGGSEASRRIGRRPHDLRHRKLELPRRVQS